MNRRTLLIAGGGVLATGALAWWRRNEITRAALSARGATDARLSSAPSLRDDSCLLTADQLEGPFFVRGPVRGDIREDRSGLPLTLRMQVVEADGCRPVAGAVVEVWHCDAAGVYSGYPEHLTRRPFDTFRYLGGIDTHKEPVNDRTFLRGAQTTGPDGVVEFRTIFPGWYEPRVPHVHAKVLVDDVNRLDAQFYFPDDFARDVFATHPDYAPHGVSPYALHNDLILGARPDATGLLLHPRRVGEELAASCRLGIA